MKIQGKKIEGSNVEVLVLPRGDKIENAIVFKCQAVLDMGDFDKICPVPKPPLVVKAGGKRLVDVDDAKYKLAVDTHSTKRMAYIILKSLEATEGLEWETVKLSEPDTWANYEQELKDSGFTQVEIMRIINTCMSANCLDEARLERARNDFLASQLPQNGDQFIPEVVPSPIASGEPANVQESKPQE
jgi:hypothetical protein